MEQIILTPEKDILKIALRGELDSASGESFYQTVRCAYLSEPKEIVFDCARLTFIDSTILGTFVKIYKECREDGNKVSLVNVQPRIRKLFEICAIDTFMEIGQ